mgnify:CR=1 FL=1
MRTAEFLLCKRFGKSISLVCVGLKCLLVSLLWHCVWNDNASAGVQNECYSAIEQAAQVTGVPKSILLAVAKVETGRLSNGVTHPWPWAINIRGVGQWLQSEAALLERALEQISKNETLFDLGCFQLNYHWHGNSFESLDAMIDPTRNANYAANFLLSLYNEFGDWSEAVGAYHSRTEARANSYKAKFAEHFDPNFIENPTVTASMAQEPEPRINTYPLLKAVSQTPRLGSLVPSATQ